MERERLPVNRGGMRRGKYFYLQQFLWAQPGDLHQQTRLQAPGPVVLPTRCVSLGMVFSVSLTIFQLEKLGIIAYKPFTKSELNNCEVL